MGNLLDAIPGVAETSKEVVVEAQIIKLRAAGMEVVVERLRKLVAERAFWQQLVATRGWSAKMLTKSRLRMASNAVSQSYSEGLANAFTDKAKDTLGVT